MIRNLARMTSSTTGTGTLTLGSAVTGFLTFDAAGVQNGELVYYGIRDGSASEVGYGTYTTSGTTLARTIIISSTNSNNAINCSGSQEVYITIPDVLGNAIDPYCLHHRGSGSSPDDDEFLTDTSANWTAILPTGNANWTFGVNHCAVVESWSIANSDIGCIVKPLTGWADGHWLETCVRGLGNDNYNYSGYGLCLTDGTSTTSNAVLANLWKGTAAGQINGRMEKGTVTNISSNASNSALDTTKINGAIRLKIKRNASNSYDWYAGVESGSIYFNWGQATFDPGFTPTHGGLFVMNFGAANRLVTSFDYFRHMS